MDDLQGFSLAVLNGAVRGMHIYRIFPPRNIILRLAIDQTSKCKYSVGVINHVVIRSEHARATMTARAYSHY